MKQGIYIFSLLLLQFLEPSCKILVTATPDVGINPAMNFAEWAINDPYENVEPSETMDVPLRYEILPTPVAFDMPFTDYYNPRKGYPDVEQYEIIPTAAIPLMSASSFRHIIHKRGAADENTEGSGGTSGDCGELSTFDNGNRTDDASCETYNTAGCSSTFACNANYTLSGPSRLTCDGSPGQYQWDGSQPTCEYNLCPALSTPQNGNRNDGSGNCPTPWSVGCSITFECNDGFSLNGQSELTCLETMETRLWSGQTPTCQVNVCDQLTATAAPTNGTVDSTCAIPGCTGTYRCDEGNSLVGQTTTVCQANGTWSGTTPTCNIRDCGNPVVDGGTFSATTTTYGSTINITCNANYTLVGNAQSTCQANGTWTQLPLCEYHCGDPPPILNATFLFICDTVNCYLNITCADGLVLEGDNLTCVRDSGWQFEAYCRDENTTAVIDISITIPAPAANARGQFYGLIQQALRNHYGNNMGNFGYFIDVVILTIEYFIANSNSGAGRRKRQVLQGELVQVNYTVLVTPTNPSSGELSKAQIDLVSSTPLIISGEPVNVLRTSIFGFTYLRNGSLDFESLQEFSCQIYEHSINGCPAGTECQVDMAGDITLCQPIGSEDDFALKLGLGLGIPLFLLACAVLGCCIYYIYLAKKRRRRKRPMRRENESSDSPTMSGFSPTMIPTRFNTIGRGGPLYGSYFPEVGEGPESEDGFEVTPRTHRSSSAPYVVSVGYQDREAFPSNFSWDFMYTHVEDFSLPRPRVL